MENSRDRVKVVGIPGGYTKIEEKPWISRGVNAKNGKFQGNHGKFEWKSREVNFKKLDILNRGGYNFFLEKPNS